MDKHDDTTNQPSQQQWGGRFNEPVDQFVARFTASIDFDYRLYRSDIQGSIAHANMLEQTRILTQAEANTIIDGLKSIQEDIEANRFEFSLELEDIHMNIEAKLTEKIGPVGKKLHTGRSRNDQVATDIRLHLREAIDAIAQQLTQLQLALATLAQQEAGTIMPGFTHLQSAQPVTFGHHLLAWYEMLQRDWERLQDCRKRVNISPLGSAALAGTSFPIDRDYTAQALGFDKPCANSLDGVSDRDFAIEFCACGALIMTHLSRMAEELVLWTSAQFRFIELPDRFCTGSSIMPQKKNPDVPELVRGKTGRVNGHLIHLLTLMKAQPLAYNKDNQEDKEPLFDTIDTLYNSLRAFADMVPHIQPMRKIMYQAAGLGFSTATDLADYLVKKGLTFRDAHHIVGRVVSYAIQNNTTLEAISLTALQEFSEVIDTDVFAILTLEGSVNARNHVGGTAPSQVRQAATTAVANINERLVSHAAT